MPATYENIATTTLGANAATITFSSIPSTYTDLRLVWVANTNTSTSMYVDINANTSSLYSQTLLDGDGSTVYSDRATNSSYWYFDYAIGTISASNTFGLYTLDIFSYAGSTNKTALSTVSTDRNGSGESMRAVHLFRSTSAITSIKIYLPSGTMSAGTTATLYGIKSA